MPAKGAARDITVCFWVVRPALPISQECQTSPLASSTSHEFWGTQVKGQGQCCQMEFHFREHTVSHVNMKAQDVYYESAQICMSA